MFLPSAAVIVIGNVAALPAASLTVYVGHAVLFAGQVGQLLEAGITTEVAAGVAFLIIAVSELDVTAAVYVPAAVITAT